MKLNVIRDNTGKTVATYESAAPNGASMEPVLPAGHKVESIDVADNYQNNLGTIYK